MKHKILNYLKEHGATSVHRLSLELGISRQMLHRHLKAMMEMGIVERRGAPPRVLYIHSQVSSESAHVLETKEEQYLSQRWLTITPIGKRLEGAPGFVSWCTKRGLDPKLQYKKYKEVQEKYEHLRQFGFYDATSKFRESFNESCIDQVFYLDFYSIEIFGKTKLGQLLLHAKLSQDRKLIDELAKYTEPYIVELIKRLSIDTFAMVPHSLRRTTPLLPGLKQRWHLNLPELPLMKVTGRVPVAQKTLSKMEDRIENARETIYVQDGYMGNSDNLLLIDDAVGSGATFQETAKKIRAGGLAKKIYALALVGSLKGFDVVKEV